MKVVVIHGQGHKGVTYTLAWRVLEEIRYALTGEMTGESAVTGAGGTLERSATTGAGEVMSVTEFFLPMDGPGFCVGCNSCFLRGEASCPQASKVQPIMQAMEQADLIMLTSPNYCMEMSGAMKNLMDHFGYRWVTHRPHGNMFRKVGITISSSAGAPPLGTVKSMAKQLKWMCVPRVYTVPFVSSAMGIADLSEEKRVEMQKKAERVAKKVLRAMKHRRVGLRTKMQFLMFRGMQTGEASAWNPTDKNWWKDNGWLGSKRPWKPDDRKES